MPPPSEISVLIVDDEPPARRRIRAIVEEHPDLRIVGERGTGRGAVEAILELQPDLVFLDVQMPDGDGFAVVEEVGPARMPATVFVTAYDAHALRAFEVHALDYLLKPYDRARFDAALDRARRQLRRASDEEADARLVALARSLRDEPPAPPRLAVRAGPRTRLLALDEIDYLSSEANYVRVHAGGGSYLMRETLTALEAELPPDRFLRVHRSLMVNLSRVVEVESLFAGEYVLFLRDGTRLTSGRTYRAAVRGALGLRG